MDSYSIFMVFLAAFLIFLNGFFVLSEFCIVKVRRTRLEELAESGTPSASLAYRMTGTLDTYLSATQLGITLSSLGLGWIGEPAVAQLIDDPLAYIFGAELDSTALRSLSFVVAFSLITLLHVVLGELVPKSIAIAKAEKAVLLIAKPLHAFWILCFPIIKLFDFMASLFLGIFGIRPAKESELAHSEEEIKIIVGESLKGGVLDSMESEIIKNAVDFSDTVAREIMTPRRDVVCLDRQNSLDENMTIVRTSKYTRFPYVDGNKDAVIGMVHIRDVLQSEICHDAAKNAKSSENFAASDAAKSGENAIFDEIVRPFLIVPESSSISKILVMMNKERISAALVVDEYGGTAGLLTMEDIIEEIVGDINDEHDAISSEYKKLDGGGYEFIGRFELERVEEMMEIRFDEQTEQLTIGGYVFNLFERMPAVGEKISDDNCVYEVLSIENNSIALIRATPKELD